MTKSPEADGYAVGERIEILSPVEVIRRRPSLYLGPEQKLLSLVTLAMLDPVLAQGTHWTRIDVRWTEEGVVSITDDDLSLPTDSQPPRRHGLEEMLTSTYAGARYRGIDLLLVLALCEWFLVELHRPEGTYRLRLENGIAQTGEWAPPAPPWSTCISFKPAMQFFPGEEPLSATSLARKAQEKLEQEARMRAEPSPLPLSPLPTIQFHPGARELVLARG